MEVNWTNEAIESLRETFLKEKTTQLSRFPLSLPIFYPQFTPKESR